MSIITKPNSIQKNVSAEFTLNKLELSQLSSVSEDSYFSNTDNWKKVIVYYKSSVGKQKEVLIFDATTSSPTANFLISEKSRGNFQIQRILIKDFDNGTFTIPRSALTVTDFDISISSNSSAVLWVNPSPNVYNIEEDGGLTIGPNRGGGTYYDINSPSQVIDGDFELIFNVGNWTHDSAFGLIEINSGHYFGSVGYNGGATNNVHVSNVGVLVSPSLSSKEWKIKRVGSTTTFYTNGELNLTTTELTGPVRPHATLNPSSGGGSLISSSIIQL